MSTTWEEKYLRKSKREKVPMVGVRDSIPKNNIKGTKYYAISSMFMFFIFYLIYVIS